jgi:NAD(P)H-hydrate epimerase
MREMERLAVAAGDTWHGLMERAGAEVARRTINWAGPDTNQQVLALVGPGNNGGDALVAARHLTHHGWKVECWTWARHENRPDLVNSLQEVGVPILDIKGKERDFTSALQRSTLVLDGLLGTGLTRDIAGDLAEIIGQVQASRLPIVAIDIPTGIDSDTGTVRGTAAIAAMTVALGVLKYGHVLAPGPRYCGEIFLGDIGLGSEAEKAIVNGELLSPEGIQALLPQRSPDAHKGDFGKVMIVAGSINYVGAAALAVSGALRSGAGLVTLGCPGDLLGMLAAKLTENTFLPLPSDLGVLAAHAADKLRSNLEGYDALLVGCGISNDKATTGFLRNLLDATTGASRTGPRTIGFAARTPEEKTSEEGSSGALPSLVLDADALNILSEWDDWHRSVPPGSVLTPHPGEMARLLGTTVESVQGDRVGAARQAASDWKQVVVLKGANTIIAGPDGHIYVSPFANAALAVGGSGDVLAGCIAGFIAQGLKPVDAAQVGVFLHGMAGEMLSEEYGPSGGLAGELPVLLARASKKLREQ